MYTEPISPMLAESSKPFDSESHLFEIKWDGTRCICFVGECTSLQNRRFVNISKRYPEIQVKLKEGVKEAIFDGEIVCMVKGVPDFNALQHREHLIDEIKIQRAIEIYPVSYIVFDILSVDRRDVTKLSLIERKSLLREVLVETSNVCICDFVIGIGKKYFELSVSAGLEGVMAKRLDSPYVKGKRTGYWLKIKKLDTIDAVVVGITEGEGYRAEYFGALILGCHSNGRLVYIGKVGTGLKIKDMKAMTKVFDEIPAQPAPFFNRDLSKIGKVKKWVAPIIVAEVGFLEITKDKKLREPRFKVLRTDKFPEECVI